MKHDLPELGTVVQLTAELAFKRETVNGDVFIEGWATTETLNSYDQIVKAKAFKWAGGLKLFNGRILAFHDQRKEPVGMVEKLKLVPGKGIWVRVRLFEEAGPLFLRNIEEGMLNAFSIGFRVNKFEFDEKKDIITFTECELLEISVVNIGANKEALFAVTNGIMAELQDAKEPIGYTLSVEYTDDATVATWKYSTGAGDTTKPDTPDDFTQTSVRSINMATKDLKAGDINVEGLSLDKYETEKQELSDNIEKLNKICAELQADAQANHDGTMSKTDLMAKFGRMKEDMEKLGTAVEKGLNAVRFQQDETFQFSDYRSMLEGQQWLQNDDGTPYTELQYRAHALFQMPIDYDKHNRGIELKNLRTLADAFVVLNAQRSYMARNTGRYQLEGQPIFKQLIKQVNKFDTVLAHAMAGGNAGFGAEWVPEEMSAEFNEYLRIQPNLPNKFRTWMMPTGSSAKYPFQNGRAVVYKAAENLVDSGAQARKTNIATANKTFTPITFIGALVTSEILTEDAVLNMVALIRSELAVAILEGLESAIINGDTAGTHQDNAGGGTHYETYQVETGILGLRAIAEDDSNTINIETLAAATGVYSLVWKNFVQLKDMIGRAGSKNPTESMWITGARGRPQVQNALHQEDALGVLQYLISGLLPTVDGSEVYISGMYNEQLDSDGLGHATPASGDHTSLLCVHKPSFLIGQRRGVTLEVAKDILTQQQQFVATARYDFGKISSSDLKPVSCGINIEFAP